LCHFCGVCKGIVSGDLLLLWLFTYFLFVDRVLLLGGVRFDAASSSRDFTTQLPQGKVARAVNTCALVICSQGLLVGVGQEAA